MAWPGMVVTSYFLFAICWDFFRTLILIVQHFVKVNKRKLNNISKNSKDNQQETKDKSISVLRRYVNKVLCCNFIIDKL